jgi:hypothetical protein
MSLRDCYSLPDDEHTTVICCHCGELAILTVMMLDGEKHALSECCKSSCMDEAMYIYQVEDLYKSAGPITGFPGR